MLPGNPRYHYGVPILCCQNSKSQRISPQNILPLDAPLKCNTHTGPTEDVKLMGIRFAFLGLRNKLLEHDIRNIFLKKSYPQICETFEIRNFKTNVELIGIYSSFFVN